MKFQIVVCVIANIIFSTHTNQLSENVLDVALLYKYCIGGAIVGLRNHSILSITDFKNEDHLSLKNNHSEAKLPTELNPTTVLGQQFPFNVATVLIKAIRINNATTGGDIPHYDSVRQPNSDPNEEIRYLLFTNKNQDKFQVMKKDGSVEGTFWNSTGKTKILIHGLTSDSSMTAIENIWTQHIFDIKDAYLTKKSEVFNVVVMDWTSLSTVPLFRYPDAANATLLAGENLATFIIRLLNSGNLRSLEDIHLIGHSLGSHVAGVTGNKMQKISKDYVIERITGLDPAGPCFDSGTGELPKNTERILDKEDAKFVDIIHTNMGNIINSLGGRYGSSVQAGHVDFYPNGGEFQADCDIIENRINFCSHQKSVVFYAESILEAFVACPCDTWIAYRSAKCSCDLTTGGEYFGEYCNKTARGKLYIHKP